MEDGSIKSGDRVIQELQQHQDTFKRPIHPPIRPLLPVGETNRLRLGNMNMYDMLCQISDSIDECIIDAVTGKKHGCVCPRDIDCHLCLQTWLASSKW